MTTETILLGYYKRDKKFHDDFKDKCGRKTSMNTDCSDGLCKLKIQAIDRAIGHQKNDWLVILPWTRSQEDLKNALRFCEIFQLESKVMVRSDGYEVLARDDLMKII